MIILMQSEYLAHNGSLTFMQIKSKSSFGRLTTRTCPCSHLNIAQWMTQQNFSRVNQKLFHLFCTLPPHLLTIPLETFSHIHFRTHKSSFILFFLDYISGFHHSSYTIHLQAISIIQTLVQHRISVEWSIKITQLSKLKSTTHSHSKDCALFN